jgi:membrane associated rhomboid family serine protease
MALHYVGSDKFMPWQYFTYMFMHADMSHFFGNMLGLVIFGPLLEDFWGYRRFVIYFILCGLGSGMIYTLYQYFEFMGVEEAKNLFLANPTPENYSAFFWDYGRDVYPQIVDWIDGEFRENPSNPVYIEQAKDSVVTLFGRVMDSSMVGASGALYGIMMAFAMLFPNTEIRPFPIYIPIKAKYVVAVYAVMAYFAMVRNTPGDNVAHVAHLGGLMVGFIIIKIWQKQRTRFY